MSRSNTDAARAIGALSTLSADASMVIALRLWLLAFGLAPRREERRMFDEKPAAFLHAAFDFWVAASEAAWHRPFDPWGTTLTATSAWTATLTRKTTANRRRLLWELLNSCAKVPHSIPKALTKQDAFDVLEGAGYLGRSSHSFATHLLANGGDLRATQELLGTPPSPRPSATQTWRRRCW